MDDKKFNQPKTKRGEETLNRIISAAEEVFYEKGYHDTSINDITSRAGIGAGTFYIYFDSKLKVYEYLLQSYGKEIRKYIHKKTANCTNRRETEKEGLRAFLMFIAEHKYVFNITWESMFIDKQLFDNYFSEFSKSYVKQLKSAANKGEIKNIDPEIMSFALMGISNFVGLHWVVFKDEKDLDHVVDEVMKFLDGIFT